MSDSDAISVFDLSKTELQPVVEKAAGEGYRLIELGKGS